MSAGRFTNVTGPIEEMFNLIFDPRVVKICMALKRGKNLSIVVLHRKTGLGSLTIRGTVNRLFFARIVEISERKVSAGRTFERYGLTQLGERIMFEIDAIGSQLPEMTRSPAFTGKHAILLMVMCELKELEKGGLVELSGGNYKIESKGQEIASHLRNIRNIIIGGRPEEVRRLD